MASKERKYDQLLTQPEFQKWMWSNIDKLIPILNENSPTGLKLRLEENSPTIYGIIVSLPELGDEWRLFKIGFTHKESVSTDSRPQQLKGKIEKSRQDAEVDIAFILPIDTIDKTDFFETEKTIRENQGYPVDKDTITGHFNLQSDGQREWVLTTTKHYESIKKKLSLRNASTEVFSNEEMLFKHGRVKVPLPTNLTLSDEGKVFATATGSKSKQPSTDCSPEGKKKNQATPTEKKQKAKVEPRGTDKEPSKKSSRELDNQATPGKEKATSKATALKLPKTPTKSSSSGTKVSKKDSKTKKNLSDRF